MTIGGTQGQPPGNFLVDLPAAVGSGSGGAIGVLLSGASSLLDLELSALESTGKAKVVSNPKIATLDNKEAVLTSGVRIPFETVSDEGTQTEFIDGVTFDGTKPNDYLKKFKIGLKGKDKI